MMQLHAAVILQVCNAAYGPQVSSTLPRDPTTVEPDRDVTVMRPNPTSTTSVRKYYYGDLPFHAFVLYFRTYEVLQGCTYNHDDVRGTRCKRFQMEQ